MAAAAAKSNPKSAVLLAKGRVSPKRKIGDISHTASPKDGWPQKDAVDITGMIDDGVWAKWIKSLPQWTQELEDEIEAEFMANEVEIQKEIVLRSRNDLCTQ